MAISLLLIGEVEFKSGDPIGLDHDYSVTGIASGAPMENGIVSSKDRGNSSLNSSDSTVMAEQVSITAEGTSTSAFGDEPTYDEETCSGIQTGVEPHV